MRKYDPKYRWKISKQQRLLLSYIHKFRFITSDLLAEILEKDRSTIYERLYLLVQQGYVLKQYDSTYRIRRRPASYCLAPLGIRTLKDDPRIEQLSLRQNYRNKDFTESQIDDCLLTVRLYLAIRRQYPKQFYVYTKYQLNRVEFVRPTPPLQLVNSRDDAPGYLLDILPANTMTWLIRKRIRQHEEWAEEHDDYLYPNVLFVAGNSHTEQRIVKLTEELYEDFKFYTTTLGNLLNAAYPSVWQNPEDSLGLEEGEEPKRVALPLQHSG